MWRYPTTYPSTDLVSAPYPGTYPRSQITRVAKAGNVTDTDEQARSKQKRNKMKTLIELL
eukprot:scaffold75898_cov21-Cyclotella_meneghiniana.AAC.1